MYQGPVRYLVPYFQSMNLSCPSYHNPVDFGTYRPFHYSLTQFKIEFYSVRLIDSDGCGLRTVRVRSHARRFGFSCPERAPQFSRQFINT